MIESLRPRFNPLALPVHLFTARGFPSSSAGLLVPKLQLGNQPEACRNDAGSLVPKLQLGNQHSLGAGETSKPASAGITAGVTFHF